MNSYNLGAYLLPLTEFLNVFQTFPKTQGKKQAIDRNLDSG